MVKQLSKEFRHIVRIHGTDLDGTQKLSAAVTKIKGVDKSLSNAVVRATGLNPESRLGNMTEEDLNKVEAAIKEPAKHGVPLWMLNYRKDLQTGETSHLLTTDCTLRVKSDIDFMKKIQCRKGVRHSFGLKVRGQRTKTSGRTGRVVGVKKKGLIERARADKAEEESKE